MPARCSVFIATSLDGFIARPNGDLDWLDRANATVPEGEDCGYQAFMDTVDILVMGRHTYEKVRTFGAWPYEKPVVVLSSNPIDIPPDIDATPTPPNPPKPSTPASPPRAPSASTSTAATPSSASSPPASSPI